MTCTCLTECRRVRCSGLSDYSGSTFESVSILVPSVNSRAGPYSIRFAAFNRTWSLRLKRNSHLLSSKFAVERRRGGNETVKGTDVDGSCYYSGTVDGEPFSKVAVATCNGLVSRNCMERNILMPND